MIGGWSMTKTLNFFGFPKLQKPFNANDTNGRILRMFLLEPFAKFAFRKGIYPIALPASQPVVHAA